MPLEDREVSQALERSFTRRGMTVMTNARFDATKVEVTKDGICLMVGPEGKEPQELRAEQLLVATGRAANVEDIGLETTKVEIERGLHQGQRPDADEGAARLRDRRRRRRPVLAHTAGHEGIVAAHTIAGDKDVHAIDYVKQPRATYCRPEIASIGLTEQQCEERGLPIKVGKVPFQAIAKAIIGGEYEGFAKVIADKETDDTLGVHLIGPHATDLIAEASLGVRARGDAVGDRRRDPRPPDALRDHRRGGHGGRRPVDQLLMAGSSRPSGTEADRRDSRSAARPRRPSA